MIKRIKAEQLNARGMELHEQGKIEEALACYREAAQLRPDWPTPLYNLGLMFKIQHRWQESCDYNQRAARLDPQNQAAWWNFGIAATALGRWDLARKAWQGFGIDVPPGPGPVELPCGFGPIRINPQGDAEIVWADRIDPARAMLASIPFPESKHGWRDLVLNDGAPNGQRLYKGREYPVLDALELLQRSPFGTYVARVAFAGPNPDKSVAKLMQTATDLDGCAEDWSTSVRMLCKACSEGRPHETHDKAVAPADGVHLIGIAARSREHATKILSTWESAASKIDIHSVDDVLEPGL